MTIEPAPSTNADADEQFQLALIKVREEFNVLTAGKPDMNIKDAIELREYIRKRTDIEKADENLTPEQKAWKILFYSMDEELSKKFGKDEKDKIDSALLELTKLDLLSQNLDNLFLMGRQIEELLIRQQSYLDVHFGGNRYRENEEKMAADMLAESTPNPRRIEIANEILQMVDQYKELMLKPLFDNQNKIYELLSQFSSVYKQMPFAVANGDERILKAEKLYGEWLSLTEELYNERLKVITAVRNLVELDALIPNHIIKHNGDSTVKIPTEELAPKFAAAEVLLKEGHSKEQEITEKRAALSLEAFGHPDSYINIKQDETPQEAPKKESLKVNPLQEKVWFRFVKVIYIVVCVLAGLASIGLLSTGSDESKIIVFGIVVFFVLIRKGFYYVVLGKTTWK